MTQLPLATIAERIKTGDVLLFRGKGSFWSWLIKLVTRSRYSHAGLALRIRVGDSERLCVLEAFEGVGVRVLPLEFVLRNRPSSIDWFPLRCSDCVVSDARRELVAGYLLEKWGCRYASPWQFVRSFSYTGRLIRRCLGLTTDTDPERFFCSEVVADALKFGGFCESDFSEREAAELSPGDISEFTCLQREGTLVL